jgi:hypothetical protein
MLYSQMDFRSALPASDQNSDEGSAIAKEEAISR